MNASRVIPSPPGRPTDRARSVPHAASVVLGGILLSFAGCAEEWGSNSSSTASVVGQVTYGGVPVQRGWLEFLPVDGTVGRLRTAELGPDGRFEVGQVAVGRNGVRIVGMKPDLPGLRLLSQGYYMRREIPPEGSSSIEIDLAQESIQIQAMSSR